MTSPRSPRRRSLTKHLQLPLLITAWLFAVYMFGEYGAAIYLIGVALIAAAWLLGARAALKAALPGAVAGRVGSYHEGRRDTYEEAHQLICSLQEAAIVASRQVGHSCQLSQWWERQLMNFEKHFRDRRESEGRRV